MRWRWPWVALLAGIGWAATSQAGAMSSSSTKPDRSERERMIALIRRIARELGVPAAVALAFAEVESRFNPRAEGDLQWAAKRPELYARLVRDHPAFADNPARLEPAAWHSYGLYQLLAPYHAQATEHPRVLLDPELNARRGIGYLRRLLRQTNNDVAAARLAYIGCGPDGSRCSDQVTTEALQRFAPIYQRWEGTA